MNIRICIWIVCLLSIITMNVDATNVTVKNHQILVNGNPFFIKGVGYSPVPIGIDPESTYPYGDYFTSDYTFYNRDLPILRKMGTNTIRLWGWQNNLNHTGFLNKAYNKGIGPMYVIVTFWMGPSVYPDIHSPEELRKIREKYYPDISSPNERKRIKDDFRNMVSKHKNNSAVLMWAIGNELNAIYWDKLPDLFSLINEMAQDAHLEEGKNYHPVTTPLADINLIDTINTYNLSNLDIWSVQLYRGQSFGNFFKDYSNVSNKPLAILEYGIDSYDDKNYTEYEKIGTPYQAKYASSLWQEIKRNSNISIGGSIMAYNDEWWKGKWGQTRPGCPDYNTSYHSDCGYFTYSHPDWYANEEWWGIMRTKDNGTGPDIMQSRSVYYTLRTLWTPPASITNLTNKTYAKTYINWTWKDPKDSDFSKVVVYLNGKFKWNVTKGKQYFNATGLKNDTWYKISTHTIDTYGNINMTWRNHSAKTAK